MQQPRQMCVGDGCYWVAGIMVCGPGGQRGCVGGSSYLGVHVNQRACLLRAGELRGKGSVSPASSEETRLASWLRAQIRQFGQTGRYVYDGGKGQEKCVLINRAGGAGVEEKKKKKKGGRNLPTAGKKNISQYLKASQYFKGAKITKWPSRICRENCW